MTIKDDLEKLLPQSQPRPLLEFEPEPPRIGDTTGVAFDVQEEATTAGIASPLVEQTDAANKRVEVDGFDDFKVWSTKVATKTTFKDANGQDVVIKTVDPNTGEVPE